MAEISQKWAADTSMIAASITSLKSKAAANRSVEPKNTWPATR